MSIARDVAEKKLHETRLHHEARDRAIEELLVAAERAAAFLHLAALNFQTQERATQAQGAFDLETATRTAIENVRKFTKEPK